MALVASSTSASDQRFPEDATLVWSNPPNGVIDVGRVQDEIGFADGIRFFELVFNGPVMLTGENVDVVSTAERAPWVRQIVGSGTNWFVELSGPIPASETTILSIDHGRVMVHVHSHPGDINGDLVSDWRDLAFLKEAIATANAYDAQFDVDRNGLLDDGDIKDMELTLTGSRNTQSWLGTHYTDPPRGHCCCVGEGACELLAQGCPPLVPETTCPCNSSSCPYIGG